MSMCKEEELLTLFWRANPYGHGWIWTWTLAVILLIFTFRVLTFRLRLRPRRSSFPSEADALTTLRTKEIISDSDLKNLIDNLEDNPPHNIWENVIQKSSNSVSYMAKCCKPKDGPLKYMSVTTFEDCSVDLLVNFYMDNDYRMQWDKTVINHQQLDVVDHASSVEIGRTIKKLPFLTPREYVLAWRLWQGNDGSFYCFSKECEHASVPKDKRYVRVALFRSGWRIRKVPGRNACEIRMVHQEDAGLNVEMAKLAFAKGIWSYVCKMDDALRKYSGRKQHQMSSMAGVRLSALKVPPEFEVADNTISTVHQQNSVTTAERRLGTCMPNRMKLSKLPSNKLIANGLVILGGAICLSRGHSSLGTKVAMAYLLSKLTKRGVSPKKEGKRPTREELVS